MLNGAKDKQIRENIRQGFLFAKNLSDIAAETVKQVQDQQALASAQLKQSPFKINIKAYSPKLIIDEYLLAEKVMNPEKPAYFLVDMGLWEAQNRVEIIDTETVPANIEQMDPS